MIILFSIPIHLSPLVPLSIPPKAGERGSGGEVSIFHLFHPLGILTCSTVRVILTPPFMVSEVEPLAGEESKKPVENPVLRLAQDGERSRTTRGGDASLRSA